MLVFRPEANLEVAEILDWYMAQGRGLDAEFLRILDATIASIQRNPLQYPKVHGESRRALMRRFPYSLIFRVGADEIVVLGCIHARRDPRRWQSRK